MEDEMEAFLEAGKDEGMHENYGEISGILGGWMKIETPVGWTR
jgi:hypothetical protein